MICLKTKALRITNSELRIKCYLISTIDTNQKNTQALKKENLMIIKRK